MFTKTTIIMVGFACLLTLAGTGCVTTSALYRGNSVSPEQVVAIQDAGPHKDSVETFDIVINYTFVRGGDVLDISGQTALTERYPQLYAGLKYLYLYLFFLDADSRVLETVSLANAMNGNLEERFEFSRSLPVPTGAVGISFGYNGEVIEGAGEGLMSAHTFYRLPLQK